MACRPACTFKYITYAYAPKYTYIYIFIYTRYVERACMEENEQRKTYTYRRRVDKSLLGPRVPENNAFISPLPPTRNGKVNYMHSKRSFPSRSKSRDLFGRIYARRTLRYTYLRPWIPVPLNGELCVRRRLSVRCARYYVTRV